MQMLPLAAATRCGADALLSPLSTAAADAYTQLLSLAGVPDPADCDALIAGDALTAAAALYTACMRFFNDTPRAATMRAATFPPVLVALQEACNGGDASHSCNVMTAVAAMLAADDTALQLALQPQHRSMLRDWLENAVSTNEDVRAAATHSIALLLRGARSRMVDAPPAPDAPAAQAVMAFLAAVGASCGHAPADVFMHALRKPESAARQAALDALVAFASVPVEAVLRALYGTSGAGAYILDRSTESTKEGKERKFEIVAATLRNPVSVALGDTFLVHLRTYYEQGPFYIKPAAARTAVMEGAV